MAEEIKVVMITMPEEKLDAIFNSFRQEIKELKSVVQQNMLGRSDGKIRIGEVASILKAKGIKCGSNQTAERWLERHGLGPVSGPSSHRYYLEYKVLNKLEELGFK